MTDGTNPTTTLEYIWDRVFDTIDVIIAKLTSGKFLATLLVIWTYCTAIGTCGRLVESKVITAETYLAVMGGVAGLVTMLVKDYFNKDVKGDQNGNDIQNTNK